jgi:hypothetical protein
VLQEAWYRKRSAFDLESLLPFQNQESERGGYLVFKSRFWITSLFTLACLPGISMAQYSPSDSGQFVILGAQYGTAARHVDVTNRLKELARQDRVFRMGNSTFGVDPAPGQHKVLRIFARITNGQERFFEYQEGSVVDGSLFRGWGSGNWEGGRWNGAWEGTHYEYQPEMAAAIQHLREAQQNLEAASRDKGGHRARAVQLVQQAIRETQEGVRYDNTH